MRRLEAEASPAVLDRVHALLAEVETDEISRTRLGIAVAELVNNIIEHGRTPAGGPPHLVLTIQDGGTEVVADLHDDGIGFPPVTEEPDPMAESGRGIMLARSAVDELGFERSDGRNHWHLVVREPA